MPSPAEVMKYLPQKRKRSGKYIECETCKKVFYVYPSRLRYTESKGQIVRFCSMACYDKNGDRNPFWGQRHSEETKMRFVSNPHRNRFPYGAANPNYARFGDDFAGNSISWARPKLKLVVRKCERCGFAEEPAILQLHHKDRDRNNNDRSNLAILCPNCHMIDHLHNGDGPFRKTEKRRA